MSLAPRADGWNVLVLGHWDPLILTPAWLNEHVAAGDVVVEMARDERLPPRQTFDGVSLLVVDNRLLVSPAEPDVDGMKKAEDVALKLLDLLPHTPITAVGVNVQLEGDLGDALATNDAGALAARGLREKSAVLRRSFEHGRGRVNVTLERREDGAQLVSINHHADARGAAAAADALRGRVTEQVEHSLALAASAWG
jgi:hypothetical protein